MEPFELPPNYYLNYFKQMTELVLARYKDILSTEDLDFINSFNELDETSARLLIRLFLRKGPLFLVDKLQYNEVPNINEAITQLCQLGLLTENPAIFSWQLVELLPVAESRTLFCPDDKKVKKIDLIELCYDDETLQNCKQWGTERRIVEPTGYEVYRRLQLLYFGSEHQTLTEFVLEDIGLFKYEDYPIDQSNRLFQSREDLEITIAINDLASEFSEMSHAKDWSQLEDLALKLLKIEAGNQLQNRLNRLANRVAYRLEQLNNLDLAYELFLTNDLPPSRERRARILFKREHYTDAKQLLDEISQSPKSFEESAFLSRFSNRVYKKLNIEPAKIEKPQLKEIHLSLVTSGQRVEELACEHFPGSVWLENSLPLAVFGLIFWPVVFANKKGVWHHPFQSGPTDLYRPEFVEARTSEIESIFEHQSEWGNQIAQRWQEKEGISNPFVHWQILTHDIVSSCYTAFDPNQWSEIFRHLLSDLRHHRSGFPDLFQITENGGRFIEVKGPGDKLQDNQKQWLALFESIGVAAEVCYIEYNENHE